jgi:hypothetical protein
MGTVYFLNDHGYGALRQFIDTHHAYPERISDDQLRNIAQLLIEPYAQGDHGHSAYHIAAEWSATGADESLTLDPKHFDAIALTEA